MTDQVKKVENTGFLSFLQRLAQGISDQPGQDYNQKLLTYIQSTPHYVAAIRESLEQADLPQPQKDSIISEAEAANAESNAAMADPSYDIDNKLTSLANKIVNAGFNGQDDKLAALADKVVERGGQMPELEDVPATTPVTAAPVLAEDTADPAVELEDGSILLPPIVITATEIDENASQDYKVERGDNLWKIAKEYYGLETDKDIIKAVESIARENGLQKGTDANHIDAGQVLKLPDNPFQQGQNLDWASLDQDTKVTSGFNRAFDVAASGVPVADNINAAPEVRPAARPSDFALAG